MPWPYMMSNSTCLSGGATLFLTTFTRVWLPTTSSRSLIAPVRADVETHRGVEFQRIAARRRLRVAEHDADFHADLVDEQHDAVRLGDRAGELAQRLAHHAGLQAGELVAHLAFKLGLGRQRRDRVDDDDVDRAGPHQRVGDLERL